MGVSGANFEIVVGSESLGLEVRKSDLTEASLTLSA